MSITPDTLVTDAELAALAEVSARRIRQMAEQGILERAERGRFKLGASIRALLEHAAGTGSELQRERVRKLRADADLAELTLARERGEVAPVEQMQKMAELAFSHVRANMRNIPGRIVNQLLAESDERRFKTVLLDEIDNALRTLADGLADNLEPIEDTDE